MKICKLGEPKVIMSNENSRHSYFAWPTAVRLKNGKIATVASGFRLRHVCPFGKTVIAYSEDEGERFTLPAPVIDTVLDDRDGGIAIFGNSGVIVTSFNNRLDMQRSYREHGSQVSAAENRFSAYDMAYLDRITPEEEERDLGATYRISYDHGVTFGPIYKAPVSSPHGPTELSDGTLLWVGRTAESQRNVADRIEAHHLGSAGSWEFVGAVDPVIEHGERYDSYEPHAVSLPDGSLLAHIRVEKRDKNPKTFTIYQTRSADGGRTWSKPIRVLDRLGGSPPHLLCLPNGLLIGSYGYREEPYGIKAMVSRDGGETWETDLEISMGYPGADLGYPSTVLLRDGSFLTVFYAHRAPRDSSVILAQKWRLED